MRNLSRLAMRPASLPAARPATLPAARPATLPALAAGAALCLCLALAACSSGSASPGAGHNTSIAAPSASPAQPATGPAAEAAIKAMWQTFFNGVVPIPRRLELLQNGQEFASFVRSQAKTSLGSLVLAASARVSSVSLGPPGKASVTYTVLLGGKPVAKNLSGMAVYAGRSWKVATSSFCDLVRQAYGKKSHLIPAACGS